MTFTVFIAVWADLVRDDLFIHLSELLTDMQYMLLGVDLTYISAAYDCSDGVAVLLENWYRYYRCSSTFHHDYGLIEC